LQIADQEMNQDVAPLDENDENASASSGSSSSATSSSFSWIPQSKICSLTIPFLENYFRLPAAQFASLKSLDFHFKNHSYGKIKFLENLHCFPNCLQLNLSYNLIENLSNLRHLQLLIELNLAENSIQKVSFLFVLLFFLPDSVALFEQIDNIFHLTSLERLSLCGNQIERIPAKISELKSLQILRLNRNQVPPSFFSLLHLTLSPTHPS
jgi:Leucine-rich repeat (LRR) protein